jgi:hypothetical protein
MKPCNNKILVSVNHSQKESIEIGGGLFSLANEYESNYREKSPVICTVIEGNDLVSKGDVLLCHHNLFYLPSPYHIQDDLFSVPFGKTLFAKVYSDGTLEPICGNMLCDRVDIETTIPLPPEQRKKHIDRVVVKNPGWTMYKKEQLLFTRPHSYYEIVYNFSGKETRVHKCDSEMVMGFIKN